jgi:hypothetical protein
MAPASLRPAAGVGDPGYISIDSDPTGYDPVGSIPSYQLEPAQNNFNTGPLSSAPSRYS